MHTVWWCFFFCLLYFVLEERNALSICWFCLPYDFECWIDVSGKICNLEKCCTIFKYVLIFPALAEYSTDHIWWPFILHPAQFDHCIAEDAPVKWFDGMNAIQTKLECTHTHFRVLSQNWCFSLPVDRNHRFRTLNLNSVTQFISIAITIHLYSNRIEFTWMILSNSVDFIQNWTKTWLEKRQYLENNCFFKKI